MRPDPIAVAILVRAFGPGEAMVTERMARR